MNDTKPKKEAGMPKLILVLLIISLVVSAMLGCVNYITVDQIAENVRKQTAIAMSEVMPADSYTDAGYTGSDKLVLKVYTALRADKQMGWVVETAPSGFGGEIRMVVGLDMSGAVTGVSIIKMTETSGLGTNANESYFRDQFTGAVSALAVNKDGGTIDALTGATVTSRAVTSGVNAALSAIKEMKA